MPALPPVLLLIGISALGPVVLNGVIPANSRIVQDLNSTYGAAQLVLTIYLFAIMIAQIVLGNWADRYGRRPVMIVSLLVFALGGFICALAASMEILLFGRFVQGLGASVCMILPRTIVRDVYERDKAASFIGYMTTAMMVAPLFGPAFGGWLTDISTWRLLYAILAVLGIVFSALAWRYQHETLRQSSVRPVGSRFFDGARTLLKLRAFNAYMLIQVGSVGVYYAFLGGAPYIMMELRGMSASRYGVWFIMIAVGYLTGNLIAGKHSTKLGVDKMIGLSLLPFAVALPLFWLLSGWLHPLALFLPMQLVALSNGMCMPNVMSASMSVLPALSGSASGLAGTLQTFIGIVFTLSLGLFLRESPLPLYWLMTFSGLLTAYGYWQVQKITIANRKSV